MYGDVGGPPTPANEPSRRGAPRRRLFQAAILAEHAEHRTLDCLIRDIATGGAQLRLNPGDYAPQNAYLINLMKRVAYPAVRVWQQGTLAGVSFEGGGWHCPGLPSELAFLDEIFVFGKLRQIARLSAQGMEIGAVLKACAVSRETHQRWQETFVF